MTWDLLVESEHIGYDAAKFKQTTGYVVVVCNWLRKEGKNVHDNCLKILALAPCMISNPESF